MAPAEAHRGWPIAPDGRPYPPEPWHLGGRAQVSLWLVPVGELPAATADALPAGATPVGLGGRAVVAAAFAEYTAGGVLAYRELVTGLLVRRGRRWRGTVPAIWVDSATSRAGARSLWGIPKELARLDVDGGAQEVRWAARRNGTPLARLAFRPSRSLPGVHRLPTITLLQRGEDVEHVVRVRLLARVTAGAASWTVDPAGPLGHLHRRRPLVSAALTELSLTIGSAPSPRGRHPPRP